MRSYFFLPGVEKKLPDSTYLLFAIVILLGLIGCNNNLFAKVFHQADRLQDTVSSEMQFPAALEETASNMNTEIGAVVRSSKNDTAVSTVGIGRHWLGPVDASVSVIEVSDFQ